MKASSRQRPRTQHKPSRRTVTSGMEHSDFSSYLPRLLRSLAVALPISLLTALALALLGTAILCSLPDPDTPLLPVSLSISLLTALLLGVLIGKRTGERLLLGGTVGGALLIGLMFVLSYPFASGGESTLPSSLGLPLRGVVLLFSLLGSYLGGHLPARSSSRHGITRR